MKASLAGILTVLAATPAGAVSPGNVVQIGDVVVMEGDEEIVGTTADGHTIEDEYWMQAIAERFHQWFPAEFEGLAVFTSFDFVSIGNAVAYCSESGVAGLGGDGFGPCHGGSSRLLSLVGMHDTDQYPTMDERDEAFLSTMGQELGHSWLVQFRFRDPDTGAISEELLGRGGSHWAFTVQTEGSYLDGMNYREEADGSYTLVDYSRRYGSLDLYGMGLLGPDEVPPFYLIRDAFIDGRPFDPAQVGFGPGSVVTGRRVDLGVADIIAANGPRQPGWNGVPRRFRQAFILVTRPGETAADVMDRVAKLEGGRHAWEDRFNGDTRGRAAMCTSLSGDCPTSAIKVVSAEPVEAAGSDGDAILEPGEPVVVRVEYWNIGLDPTADAVGSLEGEAPGVELPPHEALALGSHEKSTVEFPLALSPESCGQVVEIAAVGTAQGVSRRRRFELRPGLVRGPVERFQSETGWVANADGTDDAEEGRFALGGAIWAYGHDGPGDAAWFTGPEENWWEGGIDGGATTLTSPAYDLAGLYAPRLRYWLHYDALDDLPGGYQVDPTPHLVVEATPDGASWTRLEEVGGEMRDWEMRDLILPDEIARSPVARFRWRASDDRGDDRIVHVGIDDVEILTFSEACRTPPASGCGCAVRAPSANGSRGAALFLLTLLLIRRARARSGTGGNNDAGPGAFYGCNRALRCRP